MGRDPLKSRVESLSKQWQAPEPDYKPALTRHLQKRSPRRQMYVEAVLQTVHGSKRRGIIMDISRTGLRMRFVSADGICVGDLVQVTAPLKKIRKVGTIRRKDKTDIGIEFRKPFAA
ncbi:hypothetical protein RYZ27_11820 [Hyphomonas sp. FCG-A18]|uniref:PilZ domain-containing protein n=1 Tax=Hyphomonas sp. FCG-A18 TaxID=3080019 RepID=UPI002B2DF1A9|nr:hypothetical protein RYZ27_11820 [Hyphomonas sp. FCG-A18]